MTVLKLRSQETGQTLETTAGPVGAVGVGDIVQLVQSMAADRKVMEQTISIVGHLADRLQIAEQNQQTILSMLKVLAEDSQTSRQSLLDAVNFVAERLAEAPQVNVTVPEPVVNVTVEQPPTRRTVSFERSGGVLSGAVIEEEPE